MLFTIVVPTYNRANFLRETIESVLQQRCTDYELLIVDDGSADLTRALVSEYQEAHPLKIRYLFQENRERAAARNNGIRSASGNYIVLLDSDDILLPNHLEILKEYIGKYPSCDFFSTWHCFNENGKVFRSPVSSVRQGWYDYKLFLGGNPMACNVCVKRNNPTLILFNENRNFSAMEDWIFLIENLSQNTMYLIGKVTVQMGEHKGRSMNLNKIVIHRKILANQYIKRHLKLNPGELLILESNVNFFCSVHSYLENDMYQAGNFLRKSIRQSGSLDLKHVILSVKLRLGLHLSQYVSHFFR